MGFSVNIYVDNFKIEQINLEGVPDWQIEAVLYRWAKERGISVKGVRVG